MSRKYGAKSEGETSGAPLAAHWVIGDLATPAGRVERVATRWTWRDRVGAAAVRAGLRRRGGYAVPPGLYAAGRPTAASPLLASANYKLSFDLLRRRLAGLDAWILVLDTKGINVWCAAGKGTFGTEELVRRLEAAAAARVVGRKTIILPQLAAPGVAAHEVLRRSGFRVVFGPVRAADLPAFLAAGMRATAGMRRVRFDFPDRLAVVPVELVQRAGPALLIMAALFLLSGASREGYRLATGQWPFLAAAVGANFLAGTVLTPLLLPWLPGRALSLKGAEIGLATGAALWWLGGLGPVGGAAVALLSAAAGSFLGLIFTGSTPYTSVSGVKREMRLAIPAQIAVAVAGLILWGVERIF